MNERIDKLMVKAGAYFGGEGVDYSNFDHEKFAEFIVKECISTVEGMEPGYKDYRDQIEDAFRRDCVAEIKHQFGVEE